MIYKKILNEILGFCEECSNHENCPEDECVLYRIESILIERRKNSGKINNE